jgi:hypothetical protein
MLHPFMKKQFLIGIGIIIILQSCDMSQQGHTTNDQKTNYTHFDLFVKRFINQHPQMEENDIKKQDANDEFKINVLKYFKDSAGLSYIPLKVFSINKIGRGYIIHMQNNSDYNKNDISEDSHIDVFVLTNKIVASELKQSDFDLYSIVKYRKVKFLKPDLISEVTSDMLWTNRIEIKKTHSGIDGNSYGNFILEATEIKHL